MSGLCGWLGYNATNEDNRQIIEKMAEPIVRFGSGKLLTMAKSMAALGIVSDDENIHSYQNNGVVAALWGSGEISGKALS